MDNKLIERHILGTSSAEEERQLQEWLQESEENKRFYAVMAANVSLHSTLSSSTLEEDTEAAIERLNSRIDADSRIKNIRRQTMQWAGWAIAAASLAALLVLNMGHLKQSENDKLTTTYTNTTTSVRQITIADGTQIILTPGARIAYNVDGMKDRRVVQLEGEAFFDVEKDATRPFTVKTAMVNVLVTGTSFSVKTGSPSQNTEVVLEKGSVKLLSPENVSLVSLKPNQKAVVNAINSDITVEDIFASPHIAERYNLISMLNADLTEIVRAIEKIYGVEISFNNKRPDKKYDINFLKSDSLEDIATMVEYLTGEKLTIISGIN